MSSTGLPSGSQARRPHARGILLAEAWVWPPPGSRLRLTLHQCLRSRWLCLTLSPSRTVTSGGWHLHPYPLSFSGTRSAPEWQRPGDGGGCTEVPPDPPAPWWLEASWWPAWPLPPKPAPPLLAPLFQPWDLCFPSKLLLLALTWQPAMPSLLCLLGLGGVGIRRARQPPMDQPRAVRTPCSFAAAASGACPVETFIEHPTGLSC